MKKIVFWKKKNTPKCLGQKGQQGFSLLEIIIVLAIIGTLVGIIVSRLSGASDNAKVGITNSNAANLHIKLLQYQMEHSNHFPTNEQGLQELVTQNGGVALASKEELLDGWGNPFQYKLTTEGPLLISSGKDASNPICYLQGKAQPSCKDQ